MTQRYGIIAGTGAVSTTTDATARAGVVANDADISALQTAVAGKADQAALDGLLADNATQGELDAVESALQAQIAAKPDVRLSSAVRQPDNSILLTYSDSSTQTVAAISGFSSRVIPQTYATDAEAQNGELYVQGGNRKRKKVSGQVEVLGNA